MLGRDSFSPGLQIIEYYAASSDGLAVEKLFDEPEQQPRFYVFIVRQN